MQSEEIFQAIPELAPFSQGSAKENGKKPCNTDLCPWKFCSTTHLPLLSSNLRACVFISDKKNWNTIYVILQHVHQKKSVRVCWKILAIERFSLDCRKGLVLVLVKWFYYALWLASVFTLVLALRQSSENRSIRMYIYFFKFKML